MTIEEAGLTGSPKQRKFETVIAGAIMLAMLAFVGPMARCATTPQKVVAKPTVVTPEPAKAATRDMTEAEMTSLKTIQVRALRTEIALNKAVQDQEAISKEASGLIAKILVACGYDPAKYTVSEDKNGKLTIVEIEPATK